jgi:hypothetical protein
MDQGRPKCPWTPLPSLSEWSRAADGVRPQRCTQYMHRGQAASGVRDTSTKLGKGGTGGANEGFMGAELDGTEEPCSTSSCLQSAPSLISSCSPVWMMHDADSELLPDAFGVPFAAACPWRRPATNGANALVRHALLSINVQSSSACVIKRGKVWA